MSKWEVSYKKHKTFLNIVYLDSVHHVTAVHYKYFFFLLLINLNISLAKENTVLLKST